jgi:hypothetical protein
MLAAFVNFPALSDELGERLAALEPPNEALDNLLREIHIARSSELDSNQLQRHLSDNGFSDQLAGILTDEVYVSARAVMPNSSIDDARSVCVHILGALEARGVGQDVRSFQAQAEADPTAEAVQLVVNARKLQIEAEARAAAIEDEEMAGAGLGSP